MSDFAQVLVDLDVRDDDAAMLGESIRIWLAGTQIIEPEPSDSGLSGVAYRPGPKVRAALAADTTDMSFRDLKVNGLHIEVGRTVHDAGGNGIELGCDLCAEVFVPDERYYDAVEAWVCGDDRATFACPKCGGPKLLTEWRGPWAWAFGNLGFEFWNWPPLSEGFLTAMNGRLGHRTMLIWRHV
jgi:hypothetical protein